MSARFAAAASDARADTNGFVARLALFYVAIFVALGIQLPFLPVWMSAKGLDERTIGVVLAVGAASRIFAAPLAAFATDRFAALKGAMVTAAAVAAVSTALLGISADAVAIAAAFTLASAASSVLLPFADVYTLHGLGARGRAYGPVRMWGSVAFIAGSLGAGAMSSVLAPADLVWPIVGALLLTVLAAAVLHPVPLHRAPEGPRRSAVGLLLGSPALLLALAASSLIQGSHALFYGFGSLDLLAKGLDAASVGALWAVGVAAEIVLFALSGRLPGAFSPAVFMAVGAAGAVLRWSAMALDPPAALLPALQCLHGLSFGATHLGAVQIVARAAPPGYAATTQGALAMANSAVSAAATAASGVLYSQFGTTAYAAMAGLAAVGGIAALGLARMRRTS